MPIGGRRSETAGVSSKKSVSKAKEGKAQPPASGWVVFVTIGLPIIVLTGLLFWMMMPPKVVVPQSTPGLDQGRTESTAAAPSVAPVVPNTSAGGVSAGREPMPEPGPAPVPATPKERATALVNEGARLFEEGRMEEAMARYEKALEYSPDDEDIFFSRGAVYARAGRISEAITNYLRAIEIFPGYAEAKNNLGNLYVSLNRFDDAIPLLESVIELRPDTASGYNNLGTALARQRKYAEAAKRFDEAVRLQPDYTEALVNLGVAHLSLGNLQKATNSLNAALKLRPDMPNAIQALAKAMNASRTATNANVSPLRPSGSK